MKIAKCKSQIDRRDPPHRRFNLQFSIYNFHFSISLLAIVVALLLPTAPAVANPSTTLPPGTLDSLSGSLRAFLINEMPTPLYKDDKNWGHQRRVANGVVWRGKGLKVHPETQKAPKNDGIWTRLTLTTPNIRNSLKLDLRNLKITPGGPTTFDIALSFECNAEYERQNWKAGVRVYSGSTRIRFRINLALNCEVSSRFDRQAGTIPDLLFRMRVVKADVTYDNVVFEHILGLGGEAAKLIGEAIKGGVHRFNPALEKDMLAKANAAIVKAADTREVRVHLSLMVQH